MGAQKLATIFKIYPFHVALLASSIQFVSVLKYCKGDAKMAKFNYLIYSNSYKLIIFKASRVSSLFAFIEELKEMEVGVPRGDPCDEIGVFR